MAGGMRKVTTPVPTALSVMPPLSATGGAGCVPDGGRSHRIMSHPWGIFSALMVAGLNYYLVIAISYWDIKIGLFAARVT